MIATGSSVPTKGMIMDIVFPATGSRWWRFVVAGDHEVSLWSFGTIDKVDQLYSPSIFGPPEDAVCACGKLVAAADGTLCHLCGVPCYSDSRSVRLSRLGRINLAVPCPHPLKRSAGPVLTSFPIAPVEYRRLSGTITPLGRKYEDLVRANLRVCESLPQGGDKFSFLGPKWDTSRNRLLSAICDVVGSSQQNDTLLYLLNEGISRADEYVCAIARSCGLSCEFRATI